MSGYWEDYSHSICYIRFILSTILFEMRSGYLFTGKIVFCTITILYSLCCSFGKEVQEYFHEVVCSYLLSVIKQIDK